MKMENIVKDTVPKGNTMFIKKMNMRRNKNSMMSIMKVESMRNMADSMMITIMKRY